MSNDLEYKGYHGSVEYSSEDKCLFGKVLFVDSLLMYDGESVSELEVAFHETVDSYLAHCAETGEEPNKPYSGSFNVRVGSDIHRDSVLAGYKLGMGLNEFVIYSLKTAIDGLHQAPVVQAPLEQPSKPRLVYSAAAAAPTKWEPVSATSR